MRLGDDMKARRSVCVGVVLGLMAGPPPAWADPGYVRLAPEALDAFLHQSTKPEKPGVGAGGGTDSCRWANDLECDEPGIGTSACPRGTDTSDCRFLRTGETDTCEWARDGECDEPGLGTGVCVQGSDRTDCAGMAHLRFRTDSCETAFNNVCEERETDLRNGPAICAPRTDRADCVGRKRPLTINDHFQGFDDRVLIATDVYPWTAVGQLLFDDETECTGTLVALDVVLTAAHCVHDADGKVEAGGVFSGGRDRPEGPTQARITGVFVAPRFNNDLFSSTNKLDGTDWTYLRLDRPLGEELGVVAITPLVALDGLDLVQAGYSWDTDGRLSGHIGCEGVSLNADGTLEHMCDTTRGDSGSPLMILRDEVYGIVAVDSNYRSQTDGPPTNIAARAQSFARYLQPFMDHEVGASIAPRRPTKTGGARP